MKEVTLSGEQHAAVAEIDEWLRTHDNPVFRLFGAAGVGKTTTAREVMERHPGGLQCAFSGKAAHNLAAKTGHPAQTLHSAIYRPEKCPGGRRRGEPCQHDSDRAHVVFVRNWGGALNQARYLILDECSMVNEAIGRDAESFGKPILVLGDPHQLPPPEGCGHFTHHTPDVLLEEVHRHQDDGGIIDLATNIRLGKSIDGHPFIVDDPTNLEPDIVVCGTNHLRAQVNALRRESDGVEPGTLPRPGEPLICLQNTPELGLLNGQILEVVEAETSTDGMYVVTLNDPWNDIQYTVSARTADLNRKGAVGMDDYTPNIARLSFAYAITCHKAAGSEWDSVLVLDNWRWDDHDRWLYTAVTRASNEVRVFPC
jgi:exodeoxyribonuclease-5